MYGIYLNKFETLSDFNSWLSSDKFVTPYTHLIAESSIVRYQEYIAPPPQCNALDILWASTGGELSISSNVKNPSEGYVPIGVCIAPTNFFGPNERPRFMSLKYMNGTESGSTYSDDMYWGQYGTDISTIDNITTDYSGGSSWGHMIDISSSTPSIPTVMSGSNWNTALGTKNAYAMTDVDGKNKTAKIIATATAQSNWRTDSYVTYGSGSGYAPPACCCYRYKTLGTETGDWYLPACGELAMIAYYKSRGLNTLLSSIASSYSTYSINSLGSTSEYIWSSTEYSSTHSYIVDVYNGTVSYNQKNANLHALALFQL